MLTKAKSLYQVKLILDCLPKEEYKLIPQETIDYVENNLEYDENITIDPYTPLEEQKIDDKTYEFLDEAFKKLKKVETKQDKDAQIKEYIAKAKEENETFNANIEIIRLKEIIESLKKENCKIPKAKILLVEYNEALKEKNIEIANLKNNIELLEKKLRRIPRFLRKYL